MKEIKAFQDYYPDILSHCYGCGRLNEKGYQFKSFWDGEESVMHFTPEPHHSAVPGYVYGGLLASLIDCHSTGTAAAAKYREAGRDMDSLPAFRFLTGSLLVKYHHPTPLGPLEVRGLVKEIKGRKVTVETRILSGSKVCVTGEVVAIQVPDEMLNQLL